MLCFTNFSACVRIQRQLHKSLKVPPKATDLNALLMVIQQASSVATNSNSDKALCDKYFHLGWPHKTPPPCLVTNVTGTATDQLPAKQGAN